MRTDPPEGVPDEFQLVGRVLEDKYRVDAAVDEGGFGIVYRGTHLGFDRPIAIKCLRTPPGLRGKMLKRFLKRFTDEGRLLFELSSLDAGIVTGIDIGAFEAPTGEHVPYLVLEWLDGQTLDALLEERALSQSPRFTLAEVLALLENASRRPTPRALGIEIGMDQLNAWR